MSVRIYQLSKKIGMENSELISLLTERGFQVKSASSTIDNISADSIIAEFANKAKESPDSVDGEEKVAEKKAPAPVTAPSAAAFVRSVEQIAQEKEDEARKAEEEKKEKIEAAKPAPAAPPAPVSKPAPVSAPPRIPAGPPAPKPAGPPAPKPASPPAAKAQPNPVKIPSVNPAPAAPPVKAPVPAPKAQPAAARPPVVNRPPLAPPPAAPGPASPPAPPSPGAMRPPVAAKAPEAATDGEPQEIRTIVVKPPIVVRDFAIELGLKPFKLISELMEMGIFASINQSLEEDVATKLAEKHGVILEIRHRGENANKPKKKVVQEDESKFMEERPPVVCILGHVDHGKTSLLDYIRKANVTAGEAGGITQHIGAYQVSHNDKKITFLDTPGHAAFNAMRARGADLTDISVLVVAADDGFKPQTDEALKFLQKAGAQPIVAINKIDTKGANVERVKQQMQERGVMPEDWGGEVITVPVSAIKGDGIDELLEMVLLQAEVLELKANPKKAAEGIIIEAAVEVGRGSTATVLVQGGTLKIGDALVCGPHFTKVKAMLNENGEKLKVAPPSTAVRVIGWSGTPESGQTFKTVKNERTAKREAEDNELEGRKSAIAEESDNGMSPQEKLFAAIEATRRKSLRVMIKTDVSGSVEAVVHSLLAIKSEKIHLDIISAEVGAVSPSDVKKAAVGGAQIIGFNVKNENGTQALAKSQGVKIVHYKIIYELIDQVREEMISMLDPEFKETKIGAAEVRAVFPIAKGFVAGCLVTEGRVEANAVARIVRRGRVVVESKIDTLRREKADAKEVRAGTECGIHLEKFNDYREGDVIEVYEISEVRPAL
ncbi:translation initiation factor IF-2 [Puniceicoccaceae bacterium K14]|nr:translation initiation factor IF-2 [Puniceicoccaceae bacterium K14]